MPLYKREYSDILDGARAYLTKTGSNAVDIEGTPEHALSRFSALEIAGLYNSIESVSEGLMLSSAIGEDLNRLAEEVGLSRGSAQIATDLTKLNVKFSISDKYNGSSADLAAAIGQNKLTIPVGTEISNGADKIYYLQTEITFGEDRDAEGKPVDHAVFGNVAAAGSGPQYNAQPGELRIHNLSAQAAVAAIASYIEVTNMLPINNGTQTESDDDLRYRIANAFSTQAGGNVSAILSAARSVAGVADASIIPYIYGTGTFGVRISSSTPLLSPGIIQTVQAAVDSVKSAGIRAFVLYPLYRGLHIKYEIIFRDFSIKEHSINQITLSLRDYINNLPQGATLSKAKMDALVLSNDNVSNGELTLLQSGPYDIISQAITQSKTLLHVDHTLDPDEKWFTASGLIELCTVEA